MSNEQLQQQINDLKAELNKLKSSTTIPYDVDRAFRDRFRDILVLKESVKTASSEDATVVSSVDFGLQTVGTDAVLNSPTGFIETVIAGTNYYIPYYD